jgi:hypothetical protein
MNQSFAEAFHFWTHNCIQRYAIEINNNILLNEVEHNMYRKLHGSRSIIIVLMKNRTRVWRNIYKYFDRQTVWFLII